MILYFNKNLNIEILTPTKLNIIKEQKIKIENVCKKTHNKINKR